MKKYLIGLSAPLFGMAFLSGTAAHAGQPAPTQFPASVTQCELEDRGCLRDAAANGDLVQIIDAASGDSITTPATYRDVTFLDGDLAFADEVVAFEPGLPHPSSAYAEPQRALGAPDWKRGSKCKSAESCSFTSLGSGGKMTVRFTDNILTGGGDAELDLWIFEVGPQVEDMFVEVSEDGSNWVSVGSVGGGKSGVDLDAYGFGPGNALEYVRLTDDPEKDGRRGASVGADIDAIGAINSSTPKKPRCYCE